MLCDPSSLTKPQFNWFIDRVDYYRSEWSARDGSSCFWVIVWLSFLENLSSKELKTLLIVILFLNICPITSYFQRVGILISIHQLSWDILACSSHLKMSYLGLESLISPSREMPLVHLPSKTQLCPCTIDSYLCLKWGECVN